MIEENNVFGTDKEVRAVLVTLIPKGADEREYDISLDELSRLADTAGAVTVARLTQQKENPDVRTYLGKGKIAELSDLCRKNDIDVVIFDDELSPSQIKNIENDMELDVRVIDRSMLILDIFALHAVSGEGKKAGRACSTQIYCSAPYGQGNGTFASRRRNRYERSRREQARNGQASHKAPHKCA